MVGFECAMHSFGRPQQSSARSGRLALGLVTGIAAWLVALSHFAGALHFALISHEICVAHGELVHGTSAHGGHTRDAAGAVALPASEHAGHEHCPLVGRRLEQAALLGAASVGFALVPAGATLVAVPTAAPSPSRAELLLSAPKQSPPVRA